MGNRGMTRGSKVGNIGNCTTLNVISIYKTHFSSASKDRHTWSTRAQLDAAVAEKSESITHFTTDCLLRIGSRRRAAVVSSVNFSSSSPTSSFARIHSRWSEDAIFHSRIENISLSGGHDRRNELSYRIFLGRTTMSMAMGTTLL